jgi:hypothetical protein
MLGTILVMWGSMQPELEPETFVIIYSETLYVYIICLTVKKGVMDRRSEQITNSDA